MGLYYWRWTWNGTPTPDFFLPPTPLPDFPAGQALRVLPESGSGSGPLLVWLDSVRGSNLLESGALWRGFSRVGGRDRGQSYFKGD